MHICVSDCFQPLKMYPASKIKKKIYFHLGMSNAHGKHPLKCSDPHGPRLESWSQWGTFPIHSLEAIEVKSGHVPALWALPNQF